MDGRGAGSYKLPGSAPSGPSFLISPSVKLSVAGRGEAGKEFRSIVHAVPYGVGQAYLLSLLREILFEHEVGELVFKFTPNNPFEAIRSLLLTLLFPYVQDFPKDDPTKPCKLTAFFGYKAGMTISSERRHVRLSIIETPPTVVVGVVAYGKTPRGLRSLNTVYHQHLSKDVKRSSTGAGASQRRRPLLNTPRMRN
ncbi:60S ribosomal protein L3-1 [Tanacetum coccineum]|uniref:60S ribosomal protein L3-1 n=1 Tax=Tanacetum coccineum TaxID=301880 RepID=A0ABQ5IAS6_9ASTR